MTSKSGCFLLVKTTCGARGIDCTYLEWETQRELADDERELDEARSQELDMLTIMAKRS